MREQKTTPEIARENGVHQSQVQKWKKHLREHLPELFVGERGRATGDQEELIASLYQQIGKLKMELSWIKKTASISVETRRSWVKAHPKMSIRRQCELLGINRSGLYYVLAKETDLNLKLMNMIDAQHTAIPFYGSRRLTEYLRNEGYYVNRKRI